MFHHLAWQEYGVKKNSFTLFDIIHSLKDMSSNCTLVHCNDGVGRTGVFIALFHLIHEIHCQAKHLNVFQTVINLRKDRKFMVRKLDLFDQIKILTPKLCHQGAIMLVGKRTILAYLETCA